MNDEEVHPQPDSQAWMDFARERLSPGSSIVWDFEPLAPIMGWLGDRLEITPVVVLRRFTDAVDVTLGCRVSQFNAQRQFESACLLTHHDLQFLLAKSQCDSCVDQAALNPQRCTLKTSSGFVLEWSRDQPYISVSAACSRQVQLEAAMYAQLRERWLRCLVLLAGRTP